MRRGFTLVELLVVVTIIVLLLALLAPALDRAIYQAELALCSANMDAVVTSLIQYAVNQGRHYPYRTVARSSPGAVGQTYLGENGLVISEMGAGAAGQSVYDDRRPLEGYLNLKLLVDPLSGGIDYSPQANDDNTTIITNYSMWWDWQYRGGKRSSRLGEVFTWEDRAYSVLIGDRDLNNTTLSIPNPRAAHNHPDKAGAMTFGRFQNGDHPATGAASGAGGLKLTMSGWAGAPIRGAVDSNYGHADGSVARYIDVPYNAETVGYRGLTRIPDHKLKTTDGGDGAEFFLHAPVR
jgi:prepilin-type N-terminal cleavage/methylation domain-containing protein